MSLKFNRMQIRHVLSTIEERRRVFVLSRWRQRATNGPFYATLYVTWCTPHMGNPNVATCPSSGAQTRVKLARGKRYHGTETNLFRRALAATSVYPFSSASGWRGRFCYANRIIHFQLALHPRFVKCIRFKWHVILIAPLAHCAAVLRLRNWLLSVAVVTWN